MNIVASTGREDIAVVYIAEISKGRMVEFVESLQPPLPREKKWVLLVSTMFGCPVGCMMCDAGGTYKGKLSKDEILGQIDFFVSRRYPDGVIPCEQFKIQFARMGEPALNTAVLDVLEALPGRYQARGLMPSVSTVAPAGAGSFLERLMEIKRSYYSGGHFQLQFSIHTTDPALRERLIPVKKWGFEEMAKYGERFYAPGDRKITLNFALAREMPVDPGILLQHFDPDKYLIKVTPLNPTYRAKENCLSSYIDPFQADRDYEIIDALSQAGYQVIISIGEAEESYIGSNCGQYLRRHIAADVPLCTGYTYSIQEMS